MIIGCDFHPDGSKFVGLHAEGDAERFCRQMPAPALIGMGNLPAGVTGWSTCWPRFGHEFEGGRRGARFEPATCGNSRRRIAPTPTAPVRPTVRTRRTQGPHRSFPLTPGLRLPRESFDRDQPYHRLRSPRDYDFLSPASLFNQPRQLSRYLVNRNGFLSTR
jgi:hypothetical protein